MSKIEEAQDILRTLRLPAAQQNEISAFTLLALCAIKEDTPWDQARRQSMTLSKGIMAFVASNYGREYAANTRETFRRQVLHQFVQAGVAEYNPDNPALATNSPRAHYAISMDALQAIQAYGTREWDHRAADFVAKRAAIQRKYVEERNREMVPVRFGNQEFRLSPGEHNELQAAVVTQFAPRFAPGARLLYLGDTADKQKIVDRTALKRMGIPITQHSKLPDIILLDENRNCIMLVEAVTSHGPMNDKRILEMRDLLKNCPLKRIYITAFPDIERFRQHMSDIAWETEIWLANVPEHMIHFNGEKFLQPSGE